MTRLPVRHAVALGVVHGTAEQFPISSSAHVTLLPWALRWPYGDLPPEIRKGFEVALHAGSAIGLLASVRGRRAPLLVAITATVPPAVAGFLGEKVIERRLGTPRATALALLAGSLALIIADTAAPENRAVEEATVKDALFLGAAQACALVPGVSRLGATLTAARLRGFKREAAYALADETGMPLLLAAGALKGLRLLSTGIPPEVRPGFAAGTAAACATTLVATTVKNRRKLLSPRGWSLYRAGLAVTLLATARLREGKSYE